MPPHATTRVIKIKALNSLLARHGTRVPRPAINIKKIPSATSLRPVIPGKLPARAAAALVVTVTVAFTGAVPLRLTDVGETEHTVPGGAPLQVNETV